MPTQAAIDLIVRHRIGLERYGVALNRKILSRLNKVEADIIAKVAALPQLEAGTLGPSFSTRQHLEAMLSQVRATSVEAMAVIYSTLETELGDIAVHEVEFADNVYKPAVSFQGNFITPAPQLLKAIVTTRPLQGRFIKDWLDTYPEAIKRKVHDEVMTGVLEGESIGQITTRIRGTRALNYGDALLRGTKNGIATLVRTSVNHVSNAAHKAFLDDNARVFDRYQWVSVLDARTTPVCRARSGTVYANAVNSSSPIPPAHPNCRSVIVPIVIGEEPIAENTYAKWLGDQPENVQREVLGPAKLKLWKDGRLPMDKYVTDAGRPLTLEQLKARDRAAWEKAFGSKTPGQVAVDPGRVINKTGPT